MIQALKERNNVAGTRQITISAGSTTSGVTEVNSSDMLPAASGTTDAAIENAVYSYLQAIRALGRTNVNTGEVAKALGLPRSVVDGTIGSLQQKGVKVL